MGLLCSKKNRQSALAVLSLLLGALLVRLAGLNQSLWLDEAVSVLTARDLSLPDLMTHYRSAHFQPPLHSILLWFWGRLFGWSEISMRLPSVLAGVGVVWLGWRLGKLWVDQKFGLKFGIFLAVAPFLVYYSQEARPYSLALLFGLAWMLVFSHLLKKENRRSLIWFVVTGSLSLWSGYYNVLLMPVQWLIGWKLGKRETFFKKLLLTQILTGLTFLPWLPFLMFQMEAGFDSTKSLPGWGAMVGLPLVKIVPVTMIKFMLGRITFFNKKIYGLVSLGLTGLVVWLGVKAVRIKKNRAAFLFGLVWLILPLGLVWLVSIWVPNYQPFRVMLVVPALYFLVCLATYRSKFGYVSLLMISLFGLVRFWTTPYFWREDWRALANWLKASEKVLIIPSATSQWPLIYYGVEDRVKGLSSQLAVLEAEWQTSLAWEFSYLPYLEPVFDPALIFRQRLEEGCFVKIGEIEFNQLPVEEWARDEDCD